MSDQDWTVLKLLRWTQGFFTNKGIEEPRLDAEILLGHSLGLTRVQLYTHFDKPLAPEDLASFKALMKRRVSREPVAYIVGKREFWSMPFKVDKRVLIPRPDTETLVELARHRAREMAGEPLKGRDELSSIDPSDLHEPTEEEETPTQEEAPEETPWKADRPLKIADIGTGSGAIAIALAKELPYADLVATDISAGALELARENAETLGYTDRITFWEGSFVAPLIDNDGAGSFDIIVSNPPYIAESEMESLAPEVGAHEPKLALISGQTGLEAYEALEAGAWEVLRPGGYLICEIGHEQGDTAARIFSQTEDRWQDVRVIRDRFSGQHRVLEAQRI